MRWQVNQAHERVYKRTDKTVEYKSAKTQYCFFLQHIAVALQTADGAEAALYDGKAVSAPRTARSFIRTRSDVPQIFVKKGKVRWCIASSVFGGIGLGTFGLTALIMAIIWAATSSASFGGMTILFGLMAAACGGVLNARRRTTANGLEEQNDI